MSSAAGDRRPTAHCLAGIALVLLLTAALLRAGDPSKAGPDGDGFQTIVTPFLRQHCVACHGPARQEAHFRLDTLRAEHLAGRDAHKWKTILKRLRAGEMPPEDRPRPSAAELQRLTDWLSTALHQAGVQVADRPDHFRHGNRLDHAALFRPGPTAPLDAPPRLWRLSPEIYTGLVNDLAKNHPGIAQPFTPEARGPFRDAAGASIGEPVADQLIRNALALVDLETAHTVQGRVIKGTGKAQKAFLALLDPHNPPTDSQMAAAIRAQFNLVLKRDPHEEELQRFVALMRRNIRDAGQATGVRYTLAAVFLVPEAVYRLELGQGSPDAQGRVRLAPREIAFALAYALTDKRPDKTLLEAADTGKLNTREGVAAQVRRLLDDPKTDKPRILRFFREYFGYPEAVNVFKDAKDNPEHDPRVLVDDTDRLVQDVLERDRNVLYELLTTNRSFVAYKDAAKLKKQRAEALRKYAEEQKKGKNKKPPKVGKDIFRAYNLDDFPDRQPVELPRDQRAGILTQPSWLVAYSANTENHAIHRGKWVRERLLGGTIPDLPITVDAVLPEDPKQTLRERMKVTQQSYCWQCHRKMNDLGLPFEMFDHFGRYRTTECGRPVDATGLIAGSGDPELDGPVPDALALIRKLAASERVGQVFVRHAFRYWLGRDETLGDAASLQATYRAYKESGGSMKALLTALLTSDSFLYRVLPSAPPARPSPPK